MTDPIADMFVRMKNALRIKADTVDIPHSSIKEGISKILTSEGYIKKTDVLSRMNKRFIRLTLKYRKNKQGVISYLTRISKPGRRVYKDVASLPRVESGFGTAIISTPKGLKTDSEARAEKVGGEILAYVG